MTSQKDPKDPKNPEFEYVIVDPHEAITVDYPESALNPPPLPEHIRRTIAEVEERNLRKHGWTPDWKPPKPPPPEQARRIIARNLERSLRRHGWTPDWKPPKPHR